MVTKLIIKNKASDPSAGDLAVGELGYNSDTKQLFVGNGMTDPSGVFMASSAYTAITPPLITKTSSFTISDAEANSFVRANYPATITITVPSHTAVPLPIGTEVQVIRYGAGKVVFAPQSGVSICSAGGRLAISAQYQAAALKKIDSNTWVLVGPLTDV